MKIIDILRNNKLQLSAEIFPPKFASQLANARKVVGEIGALNPSYISVTYGAGGNTVGESLALTEEIGARGIPALAHLTCVNADREQIKDVLSKFRQAGVENILTLRGDLFDGAVLKDFQHASDLVEFVRQQGDFCLGGAAYPEGHPEAGGVDRDIENLRHKVAAGLDFLVTQMFFDNNILYSYSMKLLKAGINVPLVPGIMPVTNGAQIKRICALSGTRLPQNFQNMVEKFQDRPAALQEAGIAYATEQIIDLFVNGFNNVHVYTMNKPEILGAIRGSLKEILA